MLQARHNHRLTSKRLTGNLFGAPPLSYGQTVPQTWQGKPIGLAADQPHYPVLWTPATLAGFGGLSISAYAGTLPYAVALAEPRGLRTTRVPRMIVYNDSIGYQAAVALGSQLSQRHVSAMLHPTSLSSLGSIPDLSPGNVMLACCAPTAAQTTTDGVVQTFPDAVESEWLGGDVLLLATCALNTGTAPFSYFDGSLNILPDEVFADAIARSRDLWERFQPRYSRLEAVVVTYTASTGTDPDEAASRAYHLAAYNTAVAGLDGVTLQDVGIVDVSVDPNAHIPLILAQFDQAIRDFFSIP